jgi:hypothetical protein
MGLMFTLTGMILTAFGIATRDRFDLYAKSLGINANLWWGLVLLAFGLIMLLLGRLGQKRMEKEPAPPEDQNEPRRGH